MISIDFKGCTCDRDGCERPVVAVCCEGFNREFLCERCAMRNSLREETERRKVAFSYQTDNRGHRKGKNWSKGGRR